MGEHHEDKHHRDQSRPGAPGAHQNARLRESTGEMPRYFQVVLKVVFKQGIPVQSSYVFHHVLRR